MEIIAVLLLVCGSLYAVSVMDSFKGDYVRPAGKVSINIPTLHEDPQMVEWSIKSLKSNKIVKQYPESFEFIMIGGPDANEDLKPFALMVDKVLAAPKGKLNARQTGIENSSGDIIVAVDVDTYYPPNWLGLLLKPFADPGVVAASTPTVMTEWEFFEPIMHIVKNMIWYENRMLGRGSAFRKQAYLDIGGFDLNSNQKDFSVMVIEEEYKFKSRLETKGKFVFVDAPHYSSGMMPGGGARSK